MKTLIRDVYRISFRVTRSKAFSLAFALCYMTVLNLIIMYGICLLLKVGVPEAVFALKLFVYPYLIVLTLAMVFVNLLLIMPLRRLPGDKARWPSRMHVLAYSIASLLLLLYMRILG